MTKMLVMPIYGKNMKQSGIEQSMNLKCDMQHRVLEYYQVCSNDDWVDLDLFYGKVKFCPLRFCMGRWLNNAFSETSVVCDINNGRCSKLNECMKLMSIKGQGYILTLVQISQILYL